MPSAAENIELVKIRATYKVAIISTLCYSCIFVKLVGHKKSTCKYCLGGSTERSDSYRGLRRRVLKDALM